MIDAIKKTDWHEANQCYMSAALALVKEHLEHYVARQNKNEYEKVSINQQSTDTQKALNQAAEAMPAPSALDTLCALFNLSPFERNLILLCAGLELDGSFASLCATAQGNPQSIYPTFSLALAAFPDAHWSALVPSAPLRYWRLIEISGKGMLTKNPLCIDERILNYLAGVSHMDEKLSGIIEPLYIEGELVPSHQELAVRIAEIWSQRNGTSLFPIIQLCGSDVFDKRAIAASACSQLGLNLSMTSAYVLPGGIGEMNEMVHLWEREAALSGSVLMIDCDEIDSHDAIRLNVVQRIIDQTRSAIIAIAGTRLLKIQRPLITFDVYKPSAHEQRVVWHNALSQIEDRLNGQIDTVISHFNLSAKSIRDTSIEITRRLTSERTVDEPPDDPGILLWDTCRIQTRPKFDNLAQRIKPIATWEDLVLPDHQKQILGEIAIHVRQRMKVYETWGFAAKSARGLGISALFTGASGTGKTMASEVLANELKLDLYRIDLSQAVSKYIGETEKNLKRIFDAAEEGSAILLFDEADALFGKRSEVKDSHDRYANIEISYLLQCMESYRGLAILTTNMKEALDSAFLRRIRFVMQFPFPNAEHRTEIWRRIFPSNTPLENLDMSKLAQLNIAGGNIRNIALNSAFFAADAGESVTMRHILKATRNEYTKLEKPLTSSEIGGWGET